MSARKRKVKAPAPHEPRILRNQSSIGPRRQILQQLAGQAQNDSVEAAKEVLAALQREDDASVVDGHILDMRWAMGERRGILNALHDLEQAGLL
jgi:hypothetical protein